MAYYAFLDGNNIVTEVISGKDETDTSEDWELLYSNYRGQICKRTSFNSKGGVHYDQNGIPDGKLAFRMNYASIGGMYDFDLDAFIPAKPYPSWLLNTNTCLWDAPVPYPDDGKRYKWNEATESWEITNEN